MVIKNWLNLVIMKLNMEVEMIFWSDVNKLCWLIIGDLVLSRGCLFMVIKLDDINDEKVWG